jgi:diacylglycerol kinase (ATP)
MSKKLTKAAGKPPRRRALFIVNENSRQGGEKSDKVAEILESGGILLQRETCAQPERLVHTLVEKADAVDLVILGGGDGTLNAAAPALAKTGLTMGLLPLGTANDLARTLEIPLDPEAAARVIVAGYVRRIDLGDVNGRPFFNVASLGLSVRMARELTHDVKQRWGRLGYALATLRALARMRPFTAEIRADGQVRKVRTLQISVGNGRHYGGGMTVEEDAAIDDGRLDLYSLEFNHPWKLALVYPAFRKGRHSLWKEVRTMSAAEVEIRTRRSLPINTDGEITTETPAKFRVLPKAVSVIVPDPEEGNESSARSRIIPGA